MERDFGISGLAEDRNPEIPKSPLAQGAGEEPAAGCLTAVRWPCYDEPRGRGPIEAIGDR